MMDEPFYQCPRYQKCSVNDCPLDPEYPRYTHDDDHEKICKLYPDGLPERGLIDQIKLR